MGRLPAREAALSRTPAGASKLAATTAESLANTARLQQRIRGCRLRAWFDRLQSAQADFVPFQPRIHSPQAGPGRSRTLALSHSRTLALSHSRTLALSHSRTLALSHSRTLALPHFRTPALPHFRTSALPHLLVALRASTPPPRPPTTRRE